MLLTCAFVVIAKIYDPLDATIARQMICCARSPLSCSLPSVLAPTPLATEINKASNLYFRRIMTLFIENGVRNEHLGSLKIRLYIHGYRLCLLSVPTRQSALSHLQAVCISLNVSKTWLNSFRIRHNSLMYSKRKETSNLRLPVCTMKLHTKARTQIYPLSDNKIERVSVPDDKVEWSENWDEYKPPNYTSPLVVNKPWADLDIGDSKFKANWNHLDGIINRVSHMGLYEVVDGRPRNPSGRTGLEGRGCLGRWGPNHAVDPIVTRWKRDHSNTLMTDHKTNLPILQFVAILRGDSREWAIPGGMVDPGEKITATLQREFGEEALCSIVATPRERSEIHAMVGKFFRGGTEMYKGYVDDPRNTDNAWMETVAVNFHDGTGDSVAKFPLRAGDDAIGVRWMDLSSSLVLYASHVDLLEAVSKFRKAHCSQRKTFEKAIVIHPTLVSLKAEDNI
uniref:Nudix hydrolase domain-containing protein n=1 Tax=Strigamia maritima TaxID=126957 RepID=T1J4V2_STRMM